MESEETKVAVAEKPKRKISFRHKMGLLAVIERKELSDRVDYKAISMRCGVSSGSLRNLWSQWCRGMIDMGEPQTPEETKIDARMQHEQTLQLLKRHQALVLKNYEAAIIKTEDEMTHGKLDAHEKNGLARIGREIKGIMELRALAEKGYDTILEELAQKRAQPKGPMPPDAHTKLLGLNDEDRAVELLTRAQEAQTAQAG